MRIAERCLRLSILAAWMALITFWSGQNNLPIDQPFVANALHGFQHRLAHLFAFGLLGLLARWAFDGLPMSAVSAIVLTSAFGAADEWHQTLTPGRNPAIDDWIVDTGSGVAALFVFARLRSTRLEPLVRALSPVAVSAAFVLGVGLAAGQALPAETLGVRSAAHATVQLVRDARTATREAAHQVRTFVTG